MPRLASQPVFIRCSCRACFFALTHNPYNPLSLFTEACALFLCLRLALAIAKTFSLSLPISHDPVKMIPCQLHDLISNTLLNPCALPLVSARRVVEIQFSLLPFPFRSATRRDRKGLVDQTHVTDSAMRSHCTALRFAPLHCAAATRQKDEPDSTTSQ